MKYFNIYNAGTTSVSRDNCGALSQSCPDSYRISHHLASQWFTIAGVFNPILHEDDYNFGDQRSQGLESVKTAVVGDVLNLVVIPPEHRIYDIAVKVNYRSTELGTPLQQFIPSAPLDWAEAVGVKFDVVAGVYKEVRDVNTGEITYNCIPTTERTLVANLKADEKSFAVYDEHSIVSGDLVPLVTASDERIVYGLKVVTLPTGTGITLADLKSYIALIVHATGFDAARHL